MATGSQWAGLEDVRVPGDLLLSPLDAFRAADSVDSIRERCTLAMAQPEVPASVRRELAGIMAAAADAHRVLTGGARVLAVAVLLAGCTGGDAPLAPGECREVHPDSAIVLRPGHPVCVTVVVDTVKR
jgi:hypothetical protein